MQFAPEHTGVGFALTAFAAVALDVTAIRDKRGATRSKLENIEIIFRAASKPRWYRFTTGKRMTTGLHNRPLV